MVDHIQMPKATHPLTGQQVQYCLTLVDQASQWSMLIPVPDCSARTTALATQHHWIPHRGFPRSIHSDLGSAFTSQLLSQLCATYNIDHTLASSQNHKSVSRAESAHRVILSGLRKICTEDSDWPHKLRGLLLALHTTVVTTTGLSPAFMLYLRELHLTIMAQLPINVHSHDKTLTDVTVATTRATDKLLHENTERSFETADKYYNRDTVDPTYTVGSTALLYDEHVPAGEMRKLHCFYKPVEIVECLPNYTYRIKDVGTNLILPFKVHASLLKRLHRPTFEQTRQPDASTHVRPTPLNTDVTDLLTPPSHPSQKSDTKTDTAMPAAPTSTWHPITRIKSRRRRSNGSYEYLVEWADTTASWLPARDIQPVTVRQFNAANRRKRM